MFLLIQKLFLQITWKNWHLTWKTYFFPGNFVPEDIEEIKVIKDGKTGSYVTKDKIKDADFTISTKSTVTADGK